MECGCCWVYQRVWCISPTRRCSNIGMHCMDYCGDIWRILVCDVYNRRLPLSRNKLERLSRCGFDMHVVFLDWKKRHLVVKKVSQWLSLVTSFEKFCYSETLMWGFLGNFNCVCYFACYLILLLCATYVMKCASRNCTLPFQYTWSCSVCQDALKTAAFPTEHSL